MALISRGEYPATVFGLMGRDENSATFALGWALEKCPAFAKAVVERIAGGGVSTDERVIRLQTHGEDRGFTDIEIRCGHEFHAVLEAKVGWLLPTEAQLRRYRPRLDSTGVPIPKRAMVSVSSASTEVAARRLPREVDGVEVSHLSWGAIRAIALAAQRKAHVFAEKLWLGELATHLEGYAAMERVRDNLVFVVSLGSGPMRDDGPRTWIDVVEKDGSYFHPVGNHWPTQPPNYVGFRYRGRLQSVHRVESHEIAPDVSAKNPLWPKTTMDHFIYKLGPGMKPAREMRAATPDDTITRSARVSCAIDTLLSGEFETLGAARDATKARLAEAEKGEA